VYLGVHYMSDVLAGYAAAAIWIGAVRTGYEIWLRRR
jgi:membrane-associated phospholipid phosphatase